MTLLSSWAKPLLLMTAIIRTMLGWRMQLQLPQLMQSNRKQKMQIPLSYAATAVPTATVTTIARTFNSKLLTQNSSAGLNNHKYNNINQQQQKKNKYSSEKYKIYFMREYAQSKLRLQQLKATTKLKVVTKSNYTPHSTEGRRPVIRPQSRRNSINYSNNHKIQNNNNNSKTNWQRRL
ncbi:unnamed protein product [Ceratitis capitata]|uniref:(Mediterranean fruit fly) hypothetical protein n=1 Tax=Ceratitis capitata TaxID=7213 RepID=A0A811U9C4_CERCA|nr:unnamed protein product [Ceratitis capitata]